MRGKQLATVRVMGDFGKWLIVFGLGIVACGSLLVLAGKVPWLGRLPGDFCYKSERLTVYVPLATCLLASAVLSLLFYLFRR